MAFCGKMEIVLFDLRSTHAQNSVAIPKGVEESAGPADQQVLDTMAVKVRNPEKEASWTRRFHFPAPTGHHSRVP